jgi:DNA-binding NarL/FixJ family response regulator
MASTTTRTLQDRMAGAHRFVRALSRDTTEWDPDDLAKLQELADAVETVRTQAVLGMRRNGTTDGAIAQALGVSRQAVSKRWPGGGRYVGAAGRYRTPQTNQEDTTA